MKKYILLLVALVAFGHSQAQGNNDKAKKISARKAKKEAEAAKNDPVFQDLMSAGHQHFSDNEFEEAIVKYETAANKRPINVYPRVKIADVQLAMLNYVEEPKETVPTLVPDPTPDPPKDEISQDDRVAKAYKKEEDKIKKELPPPPPPPKSDPITKEVTKIETTPVASDIKILTPEEFATNLANKYPDGVTEETYNEGTKVITRRVVVKNGKGSDYRKVQSRHSVFYFKNDKSITKFLWDTETVVD